MARASVSAVACAARQMRAQRGEAAGAEDGLGGGGDRGGLGGVEDAGVGAGDQQGGGAGGVPGAGGGGGCGEVVEDEPGGGGAQPVPVAGAAGELGGLDAGFLQHAGRRRPRRRRWRAAGSSGCGRRGRLRGSGLPTGRGSGRGRTGGRGRRWRGRRRGGVPSTSMLARAGRKQPGAPWPAPGAQVTIRSSRPAIGGTCAVRAADRASQAGRRAAAAGAGAGARWAAAGMRGCSFRGGRGVRSGGRGRGG